MMIFHKPLFLFVNIIISTLCPTAGQRLPLFLHKFRFCSKSGQLMNWKEDSKSARYRGLAGIEVWRLTYRKIFEKRFRYQLRNCSLIIVK